MSSLPTLEKRIEPVADSASLESNRVGQRDAQLDPRIRPAGSIDEEIFEDFCCPNPCRHVVYDHCSRSCGSSIQPTHARPSISATSFPTMAGVSLCHFRPCMVTNQTKTSPMLVNIGRGLPQQHGGRYRGHRPWLYVRGCSNNWRRG